LLALSHALSFRSTLFPPVQPTGEEIFPVGNISARRIVARNCIICKVPLKVSLSQHTFLATYMYFSETKRRSFVRSFVRGRTTIIRNCAIHTITQHMRHVTHAYCTLTMEYITHMHTRTHTPTVTLKRYHNPERYLTPQLSANPCFQVRKSWACHKTRMSR